MKQKDIIVATFKFIVFFTFIKIAHIIPVLLFLEFSKEAVVYSLVLICTPFILLAMQNPIAKAVTQNCTDITKITIIKYLLSVIGVIICLSTLIKAENLAFALLSNKANPLALIQSTFGIHFFTFMLGIMIIFVSIKISDTRVG